MQGWNEPCMRKRTKTTILIAGVILLLLAGAVYLRKKAPPEAARLLPESDGIVYLNLRPLRASTHFDQRPVPLDADYQKFIDATGIQPERDLDVVAFALHRMANPSGPNGGVAFSTVFEGRFDGKRLSRYLESLANSTETYDAHTIYNIPNDGRVDRVTLLGYDMVAVSNTPTPEQIHSMLDRYRTAGLPFAGSTLLSEHYHEMPLLAIAWGMGKIGLPLGENGALKVMGLSIPFPVDATFLASVEWRGSLRVRVEEITVNESEAAAAASSMQSLVTTFRMAQGTMPDSGSSADMKTLLNSTSIEHRRNRAVITATLPAALMQRLVSAPENGEAGTGLPERPEGKAEK